MENKTPQFLSRRLLLNLFIEFGPILAFFVAFNFFDFIRATIVLVCVVIVAFLLSVFIEKRVAVFSLFASGSILTFGLATVLLENPDYIIFKDTLFWGIFGLIIGGYYVRGNFILKKWFISIFDITDRGWRVVSLRWAIFAFMLAISNQFALVYLTPAGWVYYKMCTLGVLLAFSVWQFVLSRKERNPSANAWGMRI
ncbi:MAG: septation protein IspZ [Candidatus Pacebacteria bacterium]|nr:septation protein IspZ [Candidatus Paceibacterota bacterium]MBP9851306.1 septation protein IspZ [Candidatus Paceibacterota bacterium]